MVRGLHSKADDLVKLTIEIGPLILCEVIRPAISTYRDAV